MPIRWSPDCATIGTGGCFGVALVSSIKLSDVDKLHALRRLDQFRQWHSLDEKRYCLVCGEMITGRQILVIGSPRRSARLRLICPTEHCNAIPMEWVLPSEEVLITIAMMAAERHWLCLVRQVGRAMQSYQRRTTSNNISRTRPKPTDGPC